MSEHDTWSVLHLFYKIEAGLDRELVARAIKQCEAANQQVVMASLLGHKADLCVMALGADQLPQRKLQSAITAAGGNLVFSYVSRSEVSEYGKGLPPAMLEARLHPILPPEKLRSFCFYPMSKRRTSGDNWYQLDYEQRLALMIEHGTSGRAFRGRVLQLVTGSTGLDDWEWGVTLFGLGPDDLKECVYQMRFDEASARFADFGPFFTGTVGDQTEVLSCILDY